MLGHQGAASSAILLTCLCSDPEPEAALPSCVTHALSASRAGYNHDMMLRPSSGLLHGEEQFPGASAHLFPVQYICVWGLCMCINMMDLHLLIGNILFLTSVDVSVFLHIRLLVEALATVLAGIRPCV